MHKIARILSIGENEQANPPDNYWHFVTITCGDRQTLCQNIFLDGADIEFDIKEVDKGGITCEECIDIIKEFKKIKL